MVAALVHLTRTDGHFHCLTSVLKFTELPSVRQKTGRVPFIYEQHNTCIWHIVEENL
jgi:hypothetical protein